MKYEEKEKLLARLRLTNVSERLLSWGEIRVLIKIKTRGRVRVNNWRETKKALLEEGWPEDLALGKMMDYMRCRVGYVPPTIMERIWKELDTDKENVEQWNETVHKRSLHTESSANSDEIMIWDRTESIKKDPERLLTWDEIVYLAEYKGDILAFAEPKNWEEFKKMIPLGCL